VIFSFGILARASSAKFFSSVLQAVDGLGNTEVLVLPRQ
jgi:hypothetical protein